MPLLLVTTLITTLPGISGAPQDNNIMLWNAVILGLDDTLWDLQTIHPTMLISILTFYLFIFHVVYICHLENNSAENFNSLFIFVFFFQMPFFKSFPLNFQSLQSSEKYSGAIGWGLQGATSGMEDAKEQIV
ncbi:hypothetical protein V6Z11_D13G081200 [Gossypium hirsutum]|uniref:Uncharacterized protein n=3 Tax=Gossypium TaxID=3633 RepID=A0A1U8KUE0_GOSHI|nr:uncharacterized protein LOC107920726 [Gossypium hirsutum]TYG36689.1 hypothetical protein ES288_D13G083200v1 [Gossypium darwinii]TYH33787.1 hypothetical protein ES332_D13G083100v1 [Gossypium tomentosum]